MVQKTKINLSTREQRTKNTIRVACEIDLGSHLISRMQTSITLLRSTRGVVRRAGALRALSSSVLHDSKNSIGFIGLGHMGGKMCANMTRGTSKLKFKMLTNLCTAGFLVSDGVAH